MLRRALRTTYVLLCAVFAIGFVYVTYLVLGPAWVRGSIAHQWDSANHSGMLDAVSGHGRGRPVQFIDGSSVMLDQMSWVRYPRVFTGSARIVYIEGEGEFVVRTGDKSFVVRANPVSIETDTAEFRVWGTALDPVCAIEVVAGRVTVSLGVSQQAIELAAPRTWLRGAACPSYHLGPAKAARNSGASTVRN
jgi:ferric-dicitrate binding protein FerR (iron transport regulator)